VRGIALKSFLEQVEDIQKGHLVVNTCLDG